MEESTPGPLRCSVAGPCGAAEREKRPPASVSAERLVPAISAFSALAAVPSAAATCPWSVNRSCGAVEDWLQAKVAKVTSASIVFKRTGTIVLGINWVPYSPGWAARTRAPSIEETLSRPRNRQNSQVLIWVKYAFRLVNFRVKRLFRQGCNRAVAFNRRLSAFANVYPPLPHSRDADRQGESHLHLSGAPGATVVRGTEGVGSAGPADHDRIGDNLQDRLLLRGSTSWTVSPATRHGRLGKLLQLRQPLLQLGADQLGSAPEQSHRLARCVLLSRHDADEERLLAVRGKREDDVAQRLDRLLHAHLDVDLVRARRDHRHAPRSYPLVSRPVVGRSGLGVGAAEHALQPRIELLAREPFAPFAEIHDLRQHEHVGSLDQDRALDAVRVHVLLCLHHRLQAGEGGFEIAREPLLVFLRAAERLPDESLVDVARSRPEEPRARALRAHLERVVRQSRVRRDDLALDLDAVRSDRDDRHPAFDRMVGRGPVVACPGADGTAAVGAADRGVVLVSRPGNPVLQARDFREDRRGRGCDERASLHLVRRGSALRALPHRERRGGGAHDQCCEQDLLPHGRCSPEERLSPPATRTSAVERQKQPALRPPGTTRECC